MPDGDETVVYYFSHAVIGPGLDQLPIMEREMNGGNPKILEFLTMARTNRV